MTDMHSSRTDRIRRVVWVILGLVLVGTGGAGCDDAQPGAPSASAESAQPDLIDGHFTPDEYETIQGLSPLPPAPDDPTNRVSGDPQAAHLGQFLFYDTRLSADDNVSCASCHSPDHGFSVETRLGHGQGATPRHPPTLLNVAHQRWFDWDGKADSLWAQAARPLEAPAEHGTSRTAVVQLVYGSTQLRRAYTQIFGELPDLDIADVAADARPRPDHPDSDAHTAWTSLSEQRRATINRVFTNLLKSIAAYVEQLHSGDAPFDRYVEGLEQDDPDKRDAISESAKRGLALFVDEGRCVLCHNGPDFSDHTFHNLQLRPRKWMNGSPDQGRWLGVKRLKQNPFNAMSLYSDAPDGEQAQWLEFLKRTPEDHGQFKTPTLRNVARTPPYMHGGHFETLEEVVRFYSVLDESNPVGHREEMLEPLALSQQQIDDLVNFLESLNGEPLANSLKTQPDSPVPTSGSGE
jgi:cytochrome c peroxidase